MKLFLLALAVSSCSVKPPVVSTEHDQVVLDVCRAIWMKELGRDCTNRELVWCFGAAKTHSPDAIQDAVHGFEEAAAYRKHRLGTGIRGLP